MNCNIVIFLLIVSVQILVHVSELWPIQLCNPDEQQFSSVLFENLVHQREHQESGIQQTTLDSSNVSILPLNTKMFFFH